MIDAARNSNFSNFSLCNRPWVEMNNDVQYITQALAKIAGADLIIKADCNKLYCIRLFVCVWLTVAQLKSLYGPYS